LCICYNIVRFSGLVRVVHICADGRRAVNPTTGRNIFITCSSDVLHFMGSGIGLINTNI
jgi:hypothetical protein